MAQLHDMAERFAGPALTGSLIVLLAVQVARIGWAAAAPLGPIGQPGPLAPVKAPAADFAVLERFDPFFRVAMTTPAANARSSSFRLFGVRASGGSSSAIIAGADGRQSAYRIGDEVAPGVLLRAVEGDHVVLSVGGRASKLAFPAPVSNPAPAYVPLAQPSAEPDVTSVALPPGVDAAALEAMARALADGGEVPTSLRMPQS